MSKRAQYRRLAMYYPPTVYSGHAGWVWSVVSGDHRPGQHRGMYGHALEHPLVHAILLLVMNLL